jgi:CBS domain-containing protein
MAKLVRDLMHHGLLTCHLGATLGEVAVLLNQNRVHALIVTDRDGRPEGIISDYDLLAGEWLSRDEEGLAVMRTLTAADLMSKPVDTVDANMPIPEAAGELIRKDRSRLIVMDKGKPVGVISTSDFVASIARKEEPKRDIVGDVMSDAILVCRDKTPIHSAARTMTQAGWRSVLVVDSQGKPVGVVSGKGLLPFVRQEGDVNLTVAHVMHPPLTIDINASLPEAAEKMIQNHHHRLVVVDEANPESFPLGIISSFDIVAQMAMQGSVWQT